MPTRSTTSSASSLRCQGAKSAMTTFPCAHGGRQWFVVVAGRRTRDQRWEDPACNSDEHTGRGAGPQIQIPNSEVQYARCGGRLTGRSRGRTIEALARATLPGGLLPCADTHLPCWQPCPCCLAAKL